jgi:hypothetical protein
MNDMLIEQRIDKETSAQDVENVYEFLKEVCRKRTIDYYETIMGILHFSMDDAHLREFVMPRVLGGISQHEIDRTKDEFMAITAVIVLKGSKPSTPGPGFFCFKPNNMSRDVFFAKCLSTLYAYWSKN